MIASNPLFLWMIPLAGLPVLFHLFMRIRKRQYSFSTLMFFHMIDPRLSARRRIRELLVLLLRVLFILLVLLALARLIWLGTGTRGSVSLVAVIDNSGSMSGPGRDNRPKIQRAIEAAAALISGLGTRDSAGIALLVDDPLVPLPRELTTDRSLKTVLDRIVETEASGAPADAMTRAFAMLEPSRASSFEVHVFSDLQANEWNRVSEDLQSRARAGTRIIVHRIPSASDEDANVSIAGIDLPARKLIAGRRFSAGVLLVNPTFLDADIRLDTLDDRGETKTQTACVPKSGEKSVEVPLSPGDPGIHWLTARIEGDGLTFDNRAATAYSCSGRQYAVFVGDRSEFGLLPLALAPSDDTSSGLSPLFTRPEALSDTIRDKEPVFLVLTWNALAELRGQPALEAALRPRMTEDPVKLRHGAGRQQTTHSTSSRLRQDSGGQAGQAGQADNGQLTDDLLQFVEQGGNLLIVPAVRSEETGNVPEWAGAAPQAIQTVAEGGDICVFQKTAPVFNDLRNEKGDVVLRHVKAFKVHPLNIAQNSTPLLGLADGRIVLAQAHLGKGYVFTSGLAFDPTWSNLPLKPGFLALVQSMALAGASGPARAILRLVAGDRPQPAPETLTPGPAGRAPVRILSVAGSGLDWKGDPESLPVLARSGIYSMLSGGEQSVIAVSSSDQEARGQFLSDERVPALEGLDYSVRTVADLNDLIRDTLVLRTGTNLYPSFLLLAFLTFLAEGWMANRRSIKRR